MSTNLILELYRAAQEMDVDVFQEYSLGLLNSLVPFDSARYMGGMLAQQGLQVQECFLRNKPIEAISDYAPITYADTVLRKARAFPNRIIRFHPPTLFSGKENRPLFDYAKRYEHMNGMTALYLDQDSSYARVISLFRADENSHFLAQESSIVGQVLPHLLEALKINQALALYRSGKDTDRSTVAIARYNGALHFCSMGFRKLVQTEWPDWEGARLPHALVNKLARTGPAGFCTASLRISVRCVGELLFLKASNVSAPISCPAIRPELLRSAYSLTRAEARVAIVLLEGSSACNAAVYLNVSPHTVRTQIKQIYAKLGVDTRARFVKLMLELAR